MVLQYIFPLVALFAMALMMTMMMSMVMSTRAWAAAGEST